MDREEVRRRLTEDRLMLATVSGVLTTNADLIEWVDREIPDIDLITTKSYEVRPNPGHREPVLVEPEPGCFGNAVGLRNPGMEAGYRELAALRGRRRMRALLNVSISANCIEDFARLAEGFQDVADLLEMNLSCPHAADGYGAAIGSRLDTVAEYVREVRRATTGFLVVKLTPNVEEIGPIARAAVEAGADGIAAINTVGPDLFLEPWTGQPILSNPRGHRGGRSGEWIRETARLKVAEVRRAVGPEVPIIGIGGVSTGEDVRRMREAGADVVGVGSAFIRVPAQADLPGYVAALRRDAEEGLDRARRFLSPERRMAYRSHPVREVRRIGEDLAVLVLEGRLDCRSSQYAFLFLPGVGEKPFSVAHREPLSFVVRRRGELTRALFGLKPGDNLLLRGVYGADAPDSDRPRAVILAGGTGAAVVPGLLEKLRGQGKRVAVFLGVACAREAALERALAVPADGTTAPADAANCHEDGVPTDAAKCHEDAANSHTDAAKCHEDEVSWLTVADDGVQGRVIEEMRRRVGAAAGETCFYNIGPPAFMERAMAVEEEAGADERHVFASLEKRTLCGVGACGSCACGDRMLCKQGTFVSREFLRSRGLRPSDLD